MQVYQRESSGWLTYTIAYQANCYGHHIATRRQNENGLIRVHIQTGIVIGTGITTLRHKSAQKLLLEKNLVVPSHHTYKLEQTLSRGRITADITALEFSLQKETNKTPKRSHFTASPDARDMNNPKVANTLSSNLRKKIKTISSTAIRLPSQDRSTELNSASSSNHNSDSSTHNNMT